MNIYLNPSNEMIDRDLANAEGIMLFHNVKSRKEFTELVMSLFNWDRNELVYAHYYSKDNTYIVGYNRNE